MKKTTLLALFVAIYYLSYSQITNGLLLNYNFNSNVQDQSSNSNDGTTFNLIDTMNQANISNSVMYFNGTNGYVALPNSNSLKPDLPITFTAKIKVEDLSFGVRPIYHSDVYYNNYAGFWINVDVTGRIYAHISAGLGSGSGNRRTYATNEAISEGTWHRITVIINGYNDIKVYIDCRLATGIYSGSGSTVMAYSMNPGYIGQGAGNAGNPNPYFFKGSIDEVALWNRILNINEITSICDGSLTVNELSNVDYEVYPNPATSEINVKINDFINYRPVYYTIVDMTGKIILNNNLSKIGESINLKDISKGVYTINLFDDEKIIGSKRFVKN